MRKTVCGRMHRAMLSARTARESGLVVVWMLALAMLTSLVVLTGCSQKATATPTPNPTPTLVQVFQNITPTQASDMIRELGGDVAILDIRTPAEFAAFLH